MINIVEKSFNNWPIGSGPDFESVRSGPAFVLYQAKPVWVKSDRVKRSVENPGRAASRIFLIYNLTYGGPIYIGARYIGVLVSGSNPSPAKLYIIQYNTL